ncbi:MAG: hypothetical protein ACOYOA_10720 [Saprospiraceae bacterium]
MKLAIEPKGVDLEVEPNENTIKDDELMAEIIRQYNETGKLLIIGKPESKPKKHKVKSTK